MYLRKEEIKLVHLEITSKCNLLCPQCARTSRGRLNPELPIADLQWGPSLDEMFSESFSRQLDGVYFCGNFGDPAAASTLPVFVENLLSRGVSHIAVYSNGSLKSPEWWYELGESLKGRGRLIFSVDGLSDTNHIYRVNSSWPRIEANMKAAIASGVDTRWEYIVFAHNEHQVQQAENLAREMGFREFNLKATSRFYRSLLGQTVDRRDLQAPQKEELKSASLLSLEEIKSKFGSFERYAKQTPIRCKTKHIQRSVYIDFVGDLWPCCWLGAPAYFHEDEIQKRELASLVQGYDSGFNSLLQHSFDEILNHRFFVEDLERSWKCSASDRMFTCGRTCGSEFEFTSFPGYGNNRLVRFSCE